MGEKKVNLGTKVFMINMYKPTYELRVNKATVTRNLFFDQKKKNVKDFFFQFNKC